MVIYKYLGLLLLLVLLGSCTTQSGGRGYSPPSPSSKGLNFNNACSIFSENPEWLYASLEASKKWQVPIFLFLAFIHQESRFKAEARPRASNGRLLSSAYGYAQALDGTWKEYQELTGNTRGKRNRFNDAVDFIGWYVLRVYKVSGISKWDVPKMYLNYHEGIGGYRRGLHNKKPWLLEVARKVGRRGNMYHKQLKGCNIPIYLEDNGKVPKEYKKGGVPDKPLKDRVRWF